MLQFYMEKETGCHRFIPEIILKGGIVCDII